MFFAKMKNCPEVCQFRQRWTLKKKKIVKRERERIQGTGIKIPTFSPKMLSQHNSDIQKCSGVLFPFQEPISKERKKQNWKPQHLTISCFIFFFFLPTFLEQHCLAKYLMSSELQSKLKKSYIYIIRCVSYLWGKENKIKAQFSIQHVHIDSM